MKDQVTQLAEAYGYVLIEPQKNPYMISFKKEEDPIWRINVYYTTMTVQVQNYKNGEMAIYKQVDISDFEDILIKYESL